MEGFRRSDEIELGSNWDRKWDLFFHLSNDQGDFRQWLTHRKRKISNLLAPCAQGFCGTLSKEQFIVPNGYNAQMDHHHYPKSFFLRIGSGKDEPQKPQNALSSQRKLRQKLGATTTSALALTHHMMKQMLSSEFLHKAYGGMPTPLPFVRTSHFHSCQSRRSDILWLQHRHTQTKGDREGSGTNIVPRRTLLQPEPT